ncbi:hypothetical protein N5E68_21495, partial [Pseudomonas sp. GD03722]
MASICFSRTAHRQKTVGYKSFSNPRAYFFILIYQALEKTKPELASKLRLSLRRYGCSEKVTYRHSREGGSPGVSQVLDSRLRG